MPAKISKLIWIIFISFWMITIFSEYWRYDSDYHSAFDLFQYYDLLFILLGIGTIVSLYIKRQKNKPIHFLNGISILLFLLFLESISVSLFYYKLENLDLSLSGYFSHIGHILLVITCLFLIYLVVRVFGLIVMNIISPKINVFDLPLIQVSLGIMMYTFLLFVLGLFDWLYSLIIVPICVLILVIFWKSSLKIIKDTLIRKINFSNQLNFIGIFSFLLLGFLLVINLSHVLRPFPIGTDSLNLYVNIPSLISQYNGLVDGNQPYNWSLFMSTGMVVFDRMDVVLSLSFFGGVLSLFALFRLSRKWLNINYSALVVLLFYSFPMTNFLSYLDMKVDMGLLFVTLCVLLLYYNWINEVKSVDNSHSTIDFGFGKLRDTIKNRIPELLLKNRILVCIGLLAGFAFGIKLTVLFFVLAINCTIWFIKGNKLTFLGSFFLSFAIVFITNMDEHSGLREHHENVDILQYLLLFIGLLFIGFSFYKNKDQVFSLLKYSTIIGCFFLLPVLPWIGKNYSETKQLNITALLNGEKSSPSISFEKQRKAKKENLSKDEARKKRREERRKNRSESGVTKDKRIKTLRSTSRSEDLHRFMGYEFISMRYISLPYDVFIKTNISKYFTDVSFLLLLLFPLFFLFPNRSVFNRKSFFRNIGFIILSSFLLIISIPSSLLNHNKLENPSAGISFIKSSESSDFLLSYSNVINNAFLEIYSPIFNQLKNIDGAKNGYIYSFLIILFLVIIYLTYDRVKHHSKSTQSIVIFLLVYFFLWWILCSGVAWYGMLIFCLPFIFLFLNISERESEKLDRKNRNSKERIGKKYLILASCFFWIFFAFVKRSANYNSNNVEAAKHLYYPSIMSYQTDHIDHNRLMDFHFPNIRILADHINKDKDALVFRVGSPINFFIDKNDKRILNDTFLEAINSLLNRYESKEKIIEQMKSDGFKYIVFDLNMANYDSTPDKTLTNKFIRYLDFLHKNEGVELFATDRKVKLPQEQEATYGVFPEDGNIVYAGSIAIFRIK